MPAKQTERAQTNPRGDAQFNIQGMHCTSCAQNIESTIRNIPEVAEASVNFAMQTASVRWKQPKAENSEQIVQAIKKVGYRAFVHQTISESAAEISRFKIALAIILSSVYVIDMLIKMVNVASPMNYAVILLSASVAQFYLGYEFYKNCFTSLKNGYFNMDSLVAIGTTAAFLLSLSHMSWHELLQNPDRLWATPIQHGYFESSVLVICFVYIGRFLENLSTRRARRDLSDQSILIGKYATLEENGRLIQISTAELKAGQTIVVEPGQIIPVDGKIIFGQSEVDNSLLSGESMPRFLKRGDDVYAGTVNLTHLIKVSTTFAGETTRLSFIARMVQNAASSKPAIARKIDQICNLFVPAVLCIAAVTFVLWAGYDLSQDQGLSRAVLNAVAVLVIACPCALGLATPTVVMAIIGRAARQGLLVKKAAIFEDILNVNYVVLDKTGTLTYGRPAVTDIVAQEKDTLNLLRLASSAAQHSRHPLSKALISECQKRSIKLFDALNVNEVPGQGLIADFIAAKSQPQNPLDSQTITKQRIYVGNRRLLNSYAFDLTPLESSAGELSLDGKSLIFVGIQDQESSKPRQILGLIGLADEIRPNSKTLINGLKERGLKTLLLTGDTKPSAQRVAGILNIDEVMADIVPEEKAGRIQSLKQRGRIVLMIGDGINDAAALAQANIGIAIAGGSDLAMDAALVGFMRSDPNQLIKLFELGDLFRKKTRENLFWAFGFNMIGIPLAALGFLHPIIAGAAMAASSVIVILNALRINRDHAL